MESQEKHNIEWKSVWKDEYLVGICAFANAQGGKFFIGIDDNGKIIGAANLNDAVFLPFSMNQRSLRVNLHTVSLICARRCSTHMRTASIGAYLRLLEYSTVSVSAPPSSTHAFSRRFQSKSSSSIIVAP